MANITIYKASAGSGKTYTLTREFVKIILRNEFSYKTILAVTFTNKAAEEMKSRIIKEVYLISKGSDKSDHLKYFEESLNLTKEQLQAKAKTILNLLLHDYSHFSVGTIDSFFQQIIRSFAKEIGLQNGFQIELNSAAILEKAVEKLIMQIDDDKYLRKWLLAFSEDKMKDGKNWNFKDEIILIGEEIFKEEYIINSAKIAEKLKNKEIIQKFKERIVKIKKDILDNFKKLGEKGVNLISENNLEILDFKYGKTSFANYFFTAKKGNFEAYKSRVADALTDENAWFTKNSEKSKQIQIFYSNGGFESLKNLTDFYDNNSELYFSIVEVLKLINSLAVINDVFENVNSVSKEENVFLLSFAGAFIKAIIADTDTPFLYEKIGNTYSHFMIDEFQDTSTTQWENFKPLISESLAKNNTTILVGDVKQSIYRWRNGDWKLLAYAAKNSFYDGAADYKPLSDNWRSSENIINFNNETIKNAVNILQNYFNENIEEKHKTELNHLETVITDAYSDLKQEIPNTKKDKPKGYVRVEITDLNSDKDEEYDDITLAKIPIFLEEMQDKKYSLGEIAILVRTKKEGAKIVEYLLNYKNSSQAKKGYKYDVVSNEALILGNSKVVKFLVSLLKDVFNNKDEVNTAFIKYEYLNLISENEINLQEIFYKKILLLPQEYINERENLRKYSLYQITENLISIFRLNENKNNFLYLQAFKDNLRNFLSTNNPDIDSFLSWWEANGSKESVSVNEQQNAVKILSIHKSKGLEFNTVLIPFANWLFKPINNSTFWCSTNNNNFNEFDIYPLKNTNNIQQTFFYKNFYNEKINNYIDNINLLYVAFTRAKTNLIVFSEYKKPKDPKKESINSMGILLYKVLEKTLKNNVLEVGELEKAVNADLKYSVNSFDEYISGEIKQKINVKTVANSLPKKYENNQIKKGKLYHKIFENIVYFSDVRKSVINLYNEALILENEVENYISEIEKLIAKPEIKHWYNGTYKVKNEASIISQNEIKRPDRLMLNGDNIIIVDYKFGHQKEKKYNNQLKNYSALINEMGYKNVKAYLWYVMLNEVEDVLVSL